LLNDHKWLKNLLKQFEDPKKFPKCVWVFHRTGMKTYNHLLLEQQAKSLCRKKLACMTDEREALVQMLATTITGLLRASLLFSRERYLRRP